MSLVQPWPAWITRRKSLQPLDCRELKSTTPPAASRNSVLFDPQIRPLASFGALWFALPFTLFLDALSDGSSLDGWLWSVEESEVRPVVLDMPVLRTAKVVFFEPHRHPQASKSFSAATGVEATVQPGSPGLSSSFGFCARPHRARNLEA